MSRLVRVPGRVCSELAKLSGRCYDGTSYAEGGGFRRSNRGKPPRNPDRLLFG